MKLPVNLMNKCCATMTEYIMSSLIITRILPWLDKPFILTLMEASNSLTLHSAFYHSKITLEIKPLSSHKIPEADLSPTLGRGGPTWIMNFFKFFFGKWGSALFPHAKFLAWEGGLRPPPSIHPCETPCFMHAARVLISYNLQGAFNLHTTKPSCALRKSVQEVIIDTWHSWQSFFRSCFWVESEYSISLKASLMI